ncbi:MAG: energy transducer TonB, partial [Hymenobacter sp.]
TLGQVSSYRLAQRIGRVCDEEAMRVARTIPPTWVPARMGSHAVAVDYELPFNFRLKPH